MIRRRRSREVEVSATAVVLAALCGAWVSHGIEHFRLGGVAGFEASVTRSVHTYMGPTGALLVVLAAAGAHAALRAIRTLQRQLTGLRDGRVDPRRAVAAATRPRRRTYGVELPELLALLFALQLAIYVIQENAELRALGLPGAGLGVLTGQHRWVTLVHLGVALVVTGALWLLHRPVTTLAQTVRQVAALLLAAPATDVAAIRLPGATWSRATEELRGTQAWCRPPPARAA